MANAKVVVITGASHGIGAALVTAYGSAGYRVVANARSIAESDDPNVINVAGDIGDRRTADRIMADGVAPFGGRVDTLINNAGIFISKPFTEYTETDFGMLMATNIAGFFYLTQHAVRQMALQGSGHIVTITTTMAEQPIKGVPAALTSLTKGGLDAVTKELAIEYADRGIRVNAVSPGVIKTTMHPEENHAALGALHPLGRMGEIGEIVSAVMYLENADFVTGEIAHVDGGQSAGHW